MHARLAAASGSGDDALYSALLECLNESGEALLRATVRLLAQAFGAQAVFVAECVDYPATRVRILAEWDRGAFTAPREFALAGTPCNRTVADGRVNCLSDGLLDGFPQYGAKERRSYLGVPVLDPDDGRVIGHVAFWDRGPLAAGDVVGHPVFRACAARIGAELRRKRADDTMWMVAQATAPLAGPAFFRTLVHYLARALSFREVFITECVGPDAARVRMLSHWVGDGFAANDEYDLAGTPCEITIRERRTTFIGERLETMFACCAGDQAYLGLPIFDASGERVVGHIAFYDVNRRPASVVDNPVFRILASRAGVELLRRRAEDDLRASEAKYRLLVEHQTDFIARLDRSGRLRFVSPSFCARFGRPETELLGEPFAPEVHADDREAFDAARGRVAAPPHHGHAEVRVRTPDGWRWVAWVFSAAPGERDEAGGIIVSGRDVTERRRAEEEARSHLASLAHVTRLASMGEMASAIAHEVNQPLTAVVTYTQACMRLLRDGHAPVDEIVQSMGEAAAQAERASEIIRHLRSFVRKDDPELRPVAINGLVGEVLRLVRPDARQAAVDVVTVLADALPAIVVDGVQIQQVLLNLARNAIEAIAGAGCERREVRIVTRAGGDTVEVLVEDTGPGFGDATAARLFEPFFSTKADGMGIGLSISRSIVEAHGGRIGAAHAEGGGARFTVVLPAASADRDRLVLEPRDQSDHRP